MGLIVSTTGTDVPIPELGITLVHPTVDLDLAEQFSPDEAGAAESLTEAIRTGVLLWKKIVGGSVHPATDYDADWLKVEALSTGPGNAADHVALGTGSGSGITGLPPDYIEEDFEIPLHRQLIVADRFTVAAGRLTVSGRMRIL